MLIDAHCHIQDKDYPLSQATVMENAYEAGVERVVVVGTSLRTSSEALAFVSKYGSVARRRASAYAVIGIHPSQANTNFQELEALYEAATPAQQALVIGLGEIGLDYHYKDGSPTRQEQIQALEWQLDLAERLKLPIEFHVRDAFKDFWAILDNFNIKNALVHSFTDNKENAEEAMARGFYIGLNGISTFTKLKWQQELYNNLPLTSIILETDAPYLTPPPFRGKINQPARIKQIAEYHAHVRGVSLERVATITSNNFEKLFALKVGGAVKEDNETAAVLP